MNILAIVQSAVLSLDIERPSALFASTDRTWLEIADTANTAARQILDDNDWSRLMKVATVTANGGGAYPLPADYSRMVKDANLWGDGIAYTPGQQVQDFNQWMAMQSYPIETWQPRWMVFGGNLNIMPGPPTGTMLTYGYISNEIVTGADKTQFTADTDTFLLDDELLRLGIIWNWKKAKGYDFAAELAQYMERMEKQRFRDVGARQTVVGSRGLSRLGSGIGGFV